MSQHRLAADVCAAALAQAEGDEAMMRESREVLRALLVRYRELAKNHLRKP
jgi:hypothetical protein